MNVPERIADFISENEVMTIATSSENIPYCATVFYVYLPEKNLLAFMSDKDTRHSLEAMANKNVAGTIIAKNVSVSKVQGIQLTGKMFEPLDNLKEECTSRYIWTYPVAALHNSSLWAIELSFLKLTDYRLGFGKKIIWKSEE